MAFTQEQQTHEQRFTHDDRERIWELFFGKRWSLGHIGREYGVGYERIASLIDAESGRRWAKAHPNETNREKLLTDQHSHV
jgi:hypothetical protein